MNGRLEARNVSPERQVQLVILLHGICKTCRSKPGPALRAPSQVSAVILTSLSRHSWSNVSELLQCQAYLVRFRQDWTCSASLGNIRERGRLVHLSRPARKLKINSLLCKSSHNRQMEASF